jgi:hypothetical protein
MPTRKTKTTVKTRGEKEGHGREVRRSNVGKTEKDGGGEHAENKVNQLGQVSYHTLQ